MFRLIFTVAIIGFSYGLPRSAPRLDGRIVGGEPAEIQQFPYQLSLMYNGRHICGASVVGPRHAVTAAHCTAGSSASSLTIRAGTSIRDNGGQVVALSAIHQNRNYSSWDVDYDMSVLELSQDLVFGDSVQPVGLPEQEQEIPAESTAVCTGWGTTREGGSLPTQLQSVSVAIVSPQACSDAYSVAMLEITDRMICAGVPEGGKDACQGDSGGPLVVNGQLVGVVSWGIGCARSDYPGVYASVPSLRYFIQDTAGL